jgi:hypothetical protein
MSSEAKVSGESSVVEEILHHREKVLVRRLILEPDDATDWHRDVCQRVTVVLRGSALRIEFRDGGSPKLVEISASQVDWDTPSTHVHRAVNVGTDTYEEVTIFFLENVDTVPQPE